MKWSFRIARVAGIDIFVHATFFLLLAWFAWIYWTATGTVAGVLVGTAFILALFACVVLHELGHALTARRFGISTRRITLLPIGGVASLERMPREPRQEILVALAGPAVNIAIAGVLWLVLAASGHGQALGDPTHAEGGFLAQLLVVNLFLALFNLLPAFPMDGGRVLRAWLAMRMDYASATRSAASVGQGLALALGLLGLLYNPWLVFIAVFVWFGAAMEADAATFHNTFGRLPARRAMLTEFHVLSPGQPLAAVVDQVLAGSQKEFPVLEGERLVGVLTLNRLLAALRDAGPAAPVGEVMETRVPTAAPDEPLDRIMERLEECDCRLVAVLEGGRLVGIVNLDNITELVQIQRALAAGGRRAF